MSAVPSDDRLSRGRARIERTLEGLHIVIPNRRKLFVVAFLLFWLAIWSSGWVGAGGDGDTVFLYLVGPLGSAFALSTIAWLLAGRETIDAGAGRLTIRRGVGPIARTRRFDAARVVDLRVQAPSAKSRWGWHDSFGFTDAGKISFDYGAQTHSFASALDEAEAKQLVAHVQEALR